MNITDINISDCPIIKVIIDKCEIIYYFSEVYSELEQKYLPHVSIKIKNWSRFDGKHFVSELPFEKPFVKSILENEIEPFELMQEIFIENNTLILKGYSSKSKAWLEYTFKNPTVEITNNL